MDNMKFIPAPLREVEIADGFACNAARKTGEYMLSLDEGRLLAGFYENAGLKTPFVRYGGWESGLIGGHTLGHLLSALAQGACSAEPALRSRFSEKLKRIVAALAECQAHSRGKAGFLWGAPPAKTGGVEAQFDHVEEGKTNIKTQAWVPWYTMHKILRGLVDAYRLTGFAPALEVASSLGDWVWARVSRYTKAQRERVLSVEYGGMNDALYSLYALTGKEEHAAAAHVFDEERLFDLILTEGEDVLKDRHANTTVPKILGALNRYLTLHGRTLGGEKVDATRYLRVAESFFRMASERHAYVTGGMSEWEHFGRDYVLDGERTNCNCETCIVFNLLALARGLFSVTGDKRYSDYYDNAFTNQILSSQDPETGMTTYFQPMAGGFFKVFSTPYDSFWCCTGSGMENFTKLGDGIYYRRGKEVFIERYFSSVLRAEDLVIGQEADFPASDRVRFTVRKADEPAVLCFRIPDWSAGEIEVRKNGEKVNALEGNGHLVLAAREGDAVELTIPAEITLKGLPDGKDAFAFRYGGTVLAAQLGSEDMEETTTGVGVKIPARRILPSERVYFPDLYDLFENPSKYMRREGEIFRLTGGDRDLTFLPFNRLYGQRYALYLRLREGEREEEEAPREPFDTVQAGYGQYETDALHEMEEENSVGLTAEGTCRYAKAGGSFSYDFAVDPERENVLVVELRREDNGKFLKIEAGGEILFCRRLLYTLGEARYRVEIALPQALIARCGREKWADGKSRTVLRIKFSGGGRSQSARVCGFLHIFTKQ